MATGGPDGRGNGATGSGTLHDLAKNLSKLGAHFATPMAGVADAASQAAALCSDVASLFRPAVEGFAAVITARPATAPTSDGSHPHFPFPNWPLGGNGGAQNLVWTPEMGERMLREAAERFGPMIEKVLDKLEGRLNKESYPGPRGATHAWGKLQPPELRALLMAMGLPTDGDKQALVGRLADRLAMQQDQEPARVGSDQLDAAVSAAAPAALVPSGQVERLRFCAAELTHWQAQGESLLGRIEGVLSDVEASASVSRQVAGDAPLAPPSGVGISPAGARRRKRSAAAGDDGAADGGGGAAALPAKRRRAEQPAAAASADIFAGLKAELAQAQSKVAAMKELKRQGVLTTMKNVARSWDTWQVGHFMLGEDAAGIRSSLQAPRQQVADLRSGREGSRSSEQHLCGAMTALANTVAGADTRCGMPSLADLKCHHWQT